MIMKTPSRQWLEKQRKLGDGNCTAGAPTRSAPLSYAPGDPCPECHQKMLYDGGEEVSQGHPGVDPSVFCADCCVPNPVDWVRYTAADADRFMSGTNAQRNAMLRAERLAKATA